mmetsp:Transcript_9041/g.24024  ORF Transcript_9041/g.24024 Transcript_9041/m.24024 type:complete len:221 (-) Transcript_9041:235-897(-)
MRDRRLPGVVPLRGVGASLQEQVHDALLDGPAEGLRVRKRGPPRRMSIAAGDVQRRVAAQVGLVRVCAVGQQQGDCRGAAALRRVGQRRALPEVVPRPGVRPGPVLQQQPRHQVPLVALHHAGLHRQVQGPAPVAVLVTRVALLQKEPQRRQVLVAHRLVHEVRVGAGAVVSLLQRHLEHGGVTRPHGVVELLLLPPRDARRRWRGRVLRLAQVGVRGRV